VGKEESLQGRWLRIVICKTLETDVLVKSAPVDAIETESVCSPFFVGSRPQFRILEEGLAVLMPFLVTTIYVFGIEPNFLNLHKLVLLYLIKCSFQRLIMMSAFSSINLNTSGIILSFYCLSATKTGIIFNTMIILAKYLQ